MDGSKSAHPGGQRAQNERKILSLIQRHAALPGSEIARLADLSAQAVSVILRSLEADGLVMKGDPQRGRVGKPSIPMELNPCGAYAFGLKIGRRSAELALMDLTGDLVAERRFSFAYPLPGAIFEFLRDGLTEMTTSLPPKDRGRIAGLGIAAPDGIWNWHDRIGAPEAELAAWEGLDLIQYCTGFTDLPVWIVNDATAACWAEQVFGRGSAVLDYAYFFLGTFAGGGVVLNGTVVEGRSGNAGAFGSLQVPAASGQSQQLIEAASLYLLEDRLKSAGLNPAQLWQMPLDWSQFAPHVDSWTQSAAQALAHAAAQVCAVIDFQAVLIDGALPSATRSDLVNRTRDAFAQIDTRGVASPQIDAAGLGSKARVLGAACGPIFAKFF